LLSAGRNEIGHSLIEFLGCALHAFKDYLGSCAKQPFDVGWIGRRHVWQVLPSPDESQNQLSERTKTIVNNKPRRVSSNAMVPFYAAFPARAGTGLGG